MVHDLGIFEGRPHAFAVMERRGLKVILCAENAFEYLTFTRAIRYGCSAFMLATIPVFQEKAAIIARTFRRNYHRRRYLRMKRGFTRLQAVHRGNKTRFNFRKTLHAIIVIQSFLRVGLAKRVPTSFFL